MSVFSSVLRIMLLLSVLMGNTAGSGLSVPLAPEDRPTVIVAPGSPVEIAVTFNNAYPQKDDLYNAVLLAMNNHGPVKGFNLQRNDYNAGCSEAEGATAGALINANIQNAGVIGPFCSISAFGMAPLLESTSMVMISPYNTAPAVNTSGPRVYNRVVPADPGADAWFGATNQLPSVAAWALLFQSAYGNLPDQLAVYAYDAAMLLLNAIDRDSYIDGTGNLVIDRWNLLATVRNTVDHPGVTGPIVFDISGNRINQFARSAWGDGFHTATLNGHWTWHNPDPTHWSLTAKPEFLRIITQETTHNLLLLPTPGVDFEIRARVQFTPSENFQMAGITIQLDNENRLVLGRAFAGSNNLYFDRVEGGSFVGSNYATSIPQPTDTYFRIVCSGSDYSAYYSTDGLSWTFMGMHTIAFVPAWTGLYASNQNQPVGEISADFDFFVVEHRAFMNYLPLTVR